MKNILQQIKNHKIKEVDKRKTDKPLHLLEKSPLFSKDCKSLSKAILDPLKTGLICEFKRKSPSKGVFNSKALVKDYVKIYQDNKASAISILNDSHFFGALENDLSTACIDAQIPILQKDFIVDPYQIFEAKSIGVDAILLIAKMLYPKQVSEFLHLAYQLGLEVILEVQNQEEIQKYTHLNPGMIGINNRNLNTFEVDIENSIRLATLLPKNTIKIAESGLSCPQVIRELKQNGFHGFLIGEYFMNQVNPASALKQLNIDIL